MIRRDHGERPSVILTRDHLSELAMNMTTDTQPTPDERSTNWHLSATKINAIQQSSISELVKRCKAAHYVDVHVRINGNWEVFQADWIKHLEKA